MLQIVPVTRTHDIGHGPGHKIQLAIKASAQALEPEICLLLDRQEGKKKNTSTTATAITRERKEASSFTWCLIRVENTWEETFHSTIFRQMVQDLLKQ